MGVVESNIRGPPRKEFDQLESGTFTGVRHVLLVGNANKKSRGLAERQAKFRIERIGQPSKDVVWHVHIDFAGNSDEPAICQQR